MIHNASLVPGSNPILPLGVYRTALGVCLGDFWPKLVLACLLFVTRLFQLVFFDSQNNPIKQTTEHDGMNTWN